MKIIAFANQKGGVGKTTTAVTLAHGLAMQGARTLLIDLDPQGHVAVSLGSEKAPGLYRWIVQEEPLKQVTVTVRPGLDILPGNKTSEKVKRHITLSDFRETILTDRLKKCGYDVVLFDLAPSLDVLHVNGLVAADWVVIPTRLDALAVDGVKEILISLGEITQRGHNFDGYSILPTFFDRTTRETLVQLKEIAGAFGKRVWPPIPQDTRVRETAAYGKTLWEYAPSSTAIQGYIEGKNRVGGYKMVMDRIEEVLHG